MTQPYYPQPAPYRVLPRFRPLRTTALVSIGLMGVTTLVTILQSILMWRSYDHVKNFIFLNVTDDDETDRAIAVFVGSNFAMQAVLYLLIATAVAYLVWLSYARENTTFLNGPGGHRHESGWIIGAWLCPVIQFWYPLQLVQDVAKGSGLQEAESPRIRTLLYTWWLSWVGYWVIALGALLTTVVTFVVFIVQVANAADDAARSVTFYGFQDVMVRVALAVDIGFSVAALLLVVATVSSALLMLQIGNWQLQRTPQPPPPPVYQPPPAFPSYRPHA